MSCPTEWRAAGVAREEFHFRKLLFSCSDSWQLSSLSQFTTILPRVGHQRLRRSILPSPDSPAGEQRFHQGHWLRSPLFLTMSPADSQGLEEDWACLSFPGLPVTCPGFEAVKEDQLYQCGTKACVPDCISRVVWLAGKPLLCPPRSLTRHVLPLTSYIREEGDDWRQGHQLWYVCSQDRKRQSLPSTAGFCDWGFSSYFFFN